MGEVISYVELEFQRLKRRVLSETPDERAQRVKKPVTIRGVLHERDPEHRPIPWVPEIYQPDTIAMLAYVSDGLLRTAVAR